MLGYETTITPREPTKEGVERIPLKFDMDLKDWKTITRADLVFERVNHIGPSFSVRAFFNNKKAGPGTERIASNGYAGRFTIFGHGDCIGTTGHCNSAIGATIPPLAPSVPMVQNPAAPHRRMLTVTWALDRVMKNYKRGLHTVTLITILEAPRRKDCKPKSGLLTCERVSLRLYR